MGQDAQPLLDAHDLDVLAGFEVLLTCQGDYTNAVYPALRASGWKGVWIDAAKCLAYEFGHHIGFGSAESGTHRCGLGRGMSDLCGRQLHREFVVDGATGLDSNGSCEWISTMTYQAASGAGAANLKELVHQMQVLGDAARTQLQDPSTAALALDGTVAEAEGCGLPIHEFGAPLAASAPWIDRLVDEGQTREEWKAMVEANKFGAAHKIHCPLMGCAFVWVRCDAMPKR